MTGSIARFALAGLAVSGLSACASARREPVDPFVLQIEASRWDVMNGQGLEIVKELPAAAHPIDESDPGERTRLAQQMRLTVFELAQLKAWACPDQKLSRAQCAIDFMPAWAATRDRTPPSWDVLQRRSDALGDAVMPVWEELCEAKRTLTPPKPDDEDMMICPME